MQHKRLLLFKTKKVIVVIKNLCSGVHCDHITASMQLTIDETLRRRTKQMQYNEQHHITPRQIEKALKQSDLSMETGHESGTAAKVYIGPSEMTAAADPIVQHMTRPQLEKSIAETTRLMKEAAKKLDFLQAAQYRDEIVRLQKELELKE